jgi:hypothetical protein
MNDTPAPVGEAQDAVCGKMNVTAFGQIPLSRRSLYCRLRCRRENRCQRPLAVLESNLEVAFVVLAGAQPGKIGSKRPDKTQ